MYEHKKEKIVPLKTFYKQIFKNMVIAIVIMIACFMIGFTGYHYTAGVGWLDILLNVSKILSGMGPVVEIKTDGGKWFSSFYVLISGVVFITNIGAILAPAIHRVFHRLHLEE